MSACRRILPFTTIVALCLFSFPGGGLAGARELHTGVCYPEDPPGYGSATSQAAIRDMASHAIGWIQVTPYSYQPELNRPEIRAAWGDEPGIARDVALARSLGMKVMLKPHIWHRQFMSGKWRADIVMESDADWAAWFEYYERFILRWARFSEAVGVELFCVGTELSGCSLSEERRWRGLIEKVRAVYGGEITYAANWHGEFLDIPFWDALDYLGVQFFYPLSSDSAATVGDLAAGARTAIPILAEFSERWGRPVLFTEIGYRSERGSFIEPWVQSSEAAFDPLAQRDAYEAVLEVFPPEPWFAGLYFWEYEPDARLATGNPSFSPQGKPAEKVLAEHYRQARLDVEPSGPDPWLDIERAAGLRALGEAARARERLEARAGGDDAASAAAARLLLGSMELDERGVTARLASSIAEYRSAGGFPVADRHGRFPLFALLEHLTPPAPLLPQPTLDRLIEVAAGAVAPRALAASFQAQLGICCLAIGRAGEAIDAFDRALELARARAAADAGDPIELYPPREKLEQLKARAVRSMAGEPPSPSEAGR